MHCERYAAAVIEWQQKHRFALWPFLSDPIRFDRIWTVWFLFLKAAISERRLMITDTALHSWTVFLVPEVFRVRQTINKQRKRDIWQIVCRDASEQYKYFQFSFNSSAAASAVARYSASERQTILEGGRYQAIFISSLKKKYLHTTSSAGRDNALRLWPLVTHTTLKSECKS